ncbi:hypothetical protein ACOGYP_001848 [Edwardsiella piscicida]|nr:hypothetical protein [Edwardsiella anguillarum]WHQ16402.1 hypothetical protein MQ085_10755 [Edwardsiella anguillarum]WHQ19937.1 hypothetical protein MQ089_10755 [Edwardsiella anguillarum]WHQ23458.1 hypothetical protein MQ094_10765 [Edwardsiella anguillarum]WHQ27031.1 hypothetical protein MQ093_10980 [Edwardsiella anguillarum]
MKPRDITPEDEYNDDLYDPLIYPTPRTPDDRCDHTAQLIWHMRQRATICSGAAWTPCPRPIPNGPAQRRNSKRTVQDLLLDAMKKRGIA